MDKTLKTVLITVGAIFGFFFILGVAADEPEVNRATPSAFEQGYMHGCVDGDEENRAYCQCTLEGLRGKYNETQIKMMADDYIKTGIIPDALIDVAESCIHFY